MIRAFHPSQAEIPFSWGKVFGRRLFTVNDPDLIHQVLVKNHSRYQKGELFQRLFRPGLGESLLTAEDESWAARRKMVVPAFHARALTALEPRMKSKIYEATENLKSTLETEDWATNLALSVSLEGLFSGGAGERTQYLAYHMKRGIDEYGKISAPDALNMPRWFPRPGKRRAKQHADKVDAVVYDLIDSRLNAKKIQDQPDLLDLIIASRDIKNTQVLGRQDIRNEVFTFFAAGYDTTANALQWALILLSERPRLQEDLAQEANQVKDWRSRKLMSQVINEVLRLYPPVFALLREAVREDTISGVKVPIGALIVIPIFYLHRSPKYWTTPLSFNFQHFGEKEVSQRPRHAYIPFGLGPRVCPGKIMALQTLNLTLSRLLTSFEIVRTDAEDIDAFAKLTLRPSQSVHLQLKPRA